jgi:ATP-dependent exoDNAse (exonuclease V) beta subunit
VGWRLKDLVIPCVSGRLGAKHLLRQITGALPFDDDELVHTVAVADLDVPVVDVLRTEAVTESGVDAAVAARAQWQLDTESVKRTAAVERHIETASSRERARGPLAAEVESFGATLLVGDGPPLPIGDAVHMVMERITIATAEDLRTVADDVCLEGAIAEQVDDVVTMCEACLRAPSLRRALAADRLWREVSFVLSDAEPDSDRDTGPLVNGRVDLVFRDADELVVIDYKTDAGVTAEDAAQHTIDRHGGQADAYRRALSAATGIPVREVVFVYCRTGVEVRVRPEGTETVALS